MILVTGANGQLGWELRRTLAPLGPLTAVDVAEMPLEDTAAIRRVVREVRPALIVNAAAYTAVDRAEDEPELAMAVNGVAPAVLADEAKRLGAAIVHYSTDYVFDGAKPGAYDEGDTPRPLGVYGETKLAGEEGVRGAGVPHLILRTSWVYGARGANFLRTILRAAAAGKPLRVVDDQRGAPTWCRMLAEATALALVQTGAVLRPDALEDYGGTYHLAGGGETTWHGFAVALLELAPPAVRAACPGITPVPTSAWPTKARRPANSRLDCTRFRDTFGLALPDWRDSLALVMAEIPAAEFTPAPEGRTPA
ncbi:MAG TPA: dTDP-4-dehydrorhamnose reductase [bacterium]